MKNDQKTYVIGDVHGHFDTLLKLREKIGSDAKLVFVGDLVDRGLKSREVIALVRKNNYFSVLGNHEEMMIKYGSIFIENYPDKLDTNSLNYWLINGGKETLLSYGLIKIDDKANLVVVKNNEALKKLSDDIQWLQTLPLYIEFPNKINGKKVVVSHSSCANIWENRNKSEWTEKFREYALWKRDIPNNNAPIFNIFGHTPQYNVDTSKNYINVDTGCYINEIAYSKLSGYCIETGKIVTIRRIFP